MPSPPTTLAEKLVNTPQRENAGTRAQQRFEFQNGWGLTRLIELHNSGADYGVAFEFHDDIVTIDSTQNPTSIKFFQVKTRPATENWTVERLSNREEGEQGPKPSIIGKMFINKKNFPNETKELGFVSNRPGGFLPPEQSGCCFNKAKTEDDLNKLIDKLKSECPDANDGDVDLFHFHHTELPIKKLDAYLRGELEEFVQRHCGQVSYNPNSFFLIVADECRSRARNIEEYQTLQSLLSVKFITKSSVLAWLEELRRRANSKPSWEGVLIDLANLPPVRRRALQAQWNRYEADQFDPTNTTLIKLRSKTREFIENNIEANTDSSLMDFANLLLPQIKRSMGDAISHVSDDYLTVIILYEFNRP